MQLPMKRHIRILTVLLAALLTLCSCGISKVRDISLTSFQIESIRPRGLRGVDIAITLGVDNPAMYAKMNGASGMVKRLGNAIGTFNVEPLALEARRTQKCHLYASIDLCEGVSILQVLAMAAKFEMSEYTLDMDTRLSLKSGIGAKFKFRDKPLTDFFKKEEAVQTVDK